MRITAARPSTGPRHPVTATPPRRPGSVRRTTTVDQRRSELGGPQTIVARGRDLRTDRDGATHVADDVTVQVELDGSGIVTSFTVDPPAPALRPLVGGHISRGLRGRVDELVPDQREGATVLHQILDDLPMAHLISSYGSSREQPAFKLEPAHAERMTDLCSGWRAGGTMLDVLDRTGIFPIPVGPPAPDLARDDDPQAWHQAPPMAPRSIRRRRRIDLWAGDVLRVDAHFRDSHCDESGVEDVLHEYTLAARVDASSSRVLASDATVHVLPWPECPGAAASAGRIVGHEVGTLRPVVAEELTGTSTCTHLNDVLRSLAGVTSLVNHLP